MFPQRETARPGAHTAGMSPKARQILVGLFALSFSGAAFARNPPSLVKLQQASAHATQSGGGYRDINWRFGSTKPTQARTASHSATPTRWR